MNLSHRMENAAITTSRQFYLAADEQDQRPVQNSVFLLHVPQIHVPQIHLSQTCVPKKSVCHLTGRLSGYFECSGLMPALARPPDRPSGDKCQYAARHVIEIRDRDT